MSSRSVSKFNEYDARQNYEEYCAYIALCRIMSSDDNQNNDSDNKKRHRRKKLKRPKPNIYTATYLWLKAHYKDNEVVKEIRQSKQKLSYSISP